MQSKGRIPRFPHFPLRCRYPLLSLQALVLDLRRAAEARRPPGPPPAPRARSRLLQALVLDLLRASEARRPPGPPPAPRARSRLPFVMLGD